MTFIRKWTAGDEWNAHAMNEVSDALNQLLRGPEVWVERALSGVTIAATTGSAFYPSTVIGFDTALANTGGMWSAASPDIITVSEDGWYDVVYGMGSGTSSLTTNHIRLLLHVNGTTGGAASGYTDPDALTVTDIREFVAGASSRPTTQRSQTIYFRAGDVIRLRASAFASRTTVSVERDQRPHLRLRWVSL